MKISLHPLVIYFLIPFTAFSQKTSQPPKTIVPLESGIMSATTSSLLGTVQKLSVTLISTKNMSAGTTASFVRLLWHDKSPYTSDATNDLKNPQALIELTDAMALISNSVLTSADLKSEQVGLRTSAGIETGAFFQKQTAAEAAQASRTEKSYVTTEAKQFEGKTVYEDAKGKYIWKTVTTSATPAGGGQWVPYIQVDDQVPVSKMALSLADYKQLSDLLLQAKNQITN